MFVIHSIIFILKFVISLISGMAAGFCFISIYNWLVKHGLPKKYEDKANVLAVVICVVVVWTVYILLNGMPLTYLLILPIIASAMVVIPIILLGTLFLVCDILQSTSIICDHAWSEEESHVLVCTKCGKVKHGWTFEQDYRSRPGP
jgi:integral membrane sensor domain MASE1